MEGETPNSAGQPVPQPLTPQEAMPAPAPVPAPPAPQEVAPAPTPPPPVPPAPAEALPDQPSEAKQPAPKPKSKMPIIIGIIALVIILLIGGYFTLFKPSGQVTTTSTQATSGKTWQIIYANDMFDPASVTIKKGDTVKFVNQGASSADIESTQNAELSLGGLATGSNLSATLNQVGTWKYYNNLNRSQTGTIIVTE